MSAENEVDIFEPVIAELQSQIEEWQRTIVSLKLMQTKRSINASIASTGVGTPAPSTQRQSPVFSNDSFFNMTIGDAAKKYLAMIKRTATARVIANALLEGGFKTQAKNFVENVRSIISRNPGFVFVNGEFGLVEWYPGRKTGPGKAKKNASSSSEDSSSSSEDEDDSSSSESES